MVHQRDVKHCRRGHFSRPIDGGTVRVELHYKVIIKDIYSIENQEAGP